jgi:hypothetical protein
VNPAEKLTRNFRTFAASPKIFSSVKTATVKTDDGSSSTIGPRQLEVFKKGGGFSGFGSATKSPGNII